MSLKYHSPLDPPSEQDWRDIERAVFAELDSTPQPLSPSEPANEGAPPGRLASRVRWLAAATGGVAAAAAAAWMLLTWTPHASPDAATTRVTTGAEASQVSLGDVRMDVEPHSRLVALGGEDRGWVVALEDGAAGFAVPPREARPRFVVEAGDVRVEGVGTRFRVDRDAQRVCVEVSRGLVRVTHADATEILSADSSWCSSTRREPNSTPAAARIESASASPSAHLDVPPEPAIEPSDTAGDGSGGLSSRDLFEAASRLEVDDPPRAIRLYRTAARRRGPWSAASLFAEARLELERGRTSRSHRLLRRYLRLYPNGTNAEAARTLLR